MFIDDEYKGNALNKRFASNEQLIFDLLDKCSNLKKAINVLAVTPTDLIEFELKIHQTSSNDQVFIAEQSNISNIPLNLRVGTKIVVQFPIEYGSHQFPAELIMVSGSPPELMFMLMDDIF
jgi:hypothetical protein